MKHAHGMVPSPSSDIQSRSPCWLSDSQSTRTPSVRQVGLIISLWSRSSVCQHTLDWQYSDGAWDFDDSINLWILRQSTNGRRSTRCNVVRGMERVWQPFMSIFIETSNISASSIYTHDLYILDVESLLPFLFDFW